MSGFVPPPHTSKTDSTQGSAPPKKTEVTREEKIALEVINDFRELPFADLSDREICSLLESSPEEEEQGAILEEAEGSEIVAEEKPINREAVQTKRKRGNLETSQALVVLGALPLAVSRVASMILKTARRLEEGARAKERRREVEEQKAERRWERVQQDAQAHRERLGLTKGEAGKGRTRKGSARAIKEKQEGVFGPQGEKRYRENKKKGMPASPPRKPNVNP